MNPLTSISVEIKVHPMYLNPVTADTYVPPILNGAVTAFLSTKLTPRLAREALPPGIPVAGHYFSRWKVLFVTTAIASYVVNQWFQSREAWLLANYGSYKAKLEIDAWNGLKVGLGSSILGTVLLGGMAGIGYLNYFVSSVASNVIVEMGYPYLRPYITGTPVDYRAASCVPQVTAPAPVMAGYTLNSDAQASQHGAPMVTTMSYMPLSNDYNAYTGPGGNRITNTTNSLMEGWFPGSLHYGMIG